MQDWPRAVAISAIWASAGVALTFGLFKMNFRGHAGISIFLPLMLALIVIGGPTIATIAICRTRRRDD